MPFQAQHILKAQILRLFKTVIGHCSLWLRSSTPPLHTGERASYTECRRWFPNSLLNCGGNLVRQWDLLAPVSLTVDYKSSNSWVIWRDPQPVARVFLCCLGGDEALQLCRQLDWGACWKPQCWGAARVGLFCRRRGARRQQWPQHRHHACDTSDHSTGMLSSAPGQGKQRWGWWHVLLTTRQPGNGKVTSPKSVEESYSGTAGNRNRPG